MEKDKELKVKTYAIKKIEDEHTKVMEGLREEHETEIQRAKDLDKEVKEVQRKLEDCDIEFPKEV